MTVPRFGRSYYGLYTVSTKDTAYEGTYWQVGSNHLLTNFIEAELIKDSRIQYWLPD